MESILWLAVARSWKESDLGKEKDKVWKMKKDVVAEPKREKVMVRMEWMGVGGKGGRSWVGRLEEALRAEETRKIGQHTVESKKETGALWYDA
jgi:hypothetical protein